MTKNTFFLIDPWWENENNIFNFSRIEIASHFFFVFFALSHQGLGGEISVHPPNGICWWENEKKSASASICSNQDISATFCPNDMGGSAFESPADKFLRKKFILPQSPLIYKGFEEGSIRKSVIFDKTSRPQIQRKTVVNEVKWFQKLFVWKVWTLSFPTHFESNDLDKNSTR